jgi:manganese/iron transport system ATP-binding protein
VLGGENLHDDADPRQLSVISDDERPLVMYGARDRMVAQPAKPESDSEADSE